MGGFREYMRQHTLEQVRLRLVAGEPEPDDRLARAVADGLFRTPHVGTLRDCHLASENAWLDAMDDDAILDVAAMNTSVELLAAQLRVRWITDGFWTLTSPSYSTNVLLTMLDDQVPTPSGEALRLDDGVLVAAPMVRTLVFAELRGPGSFLEGVEFLIEEALQHESRPDFLDAKVYLARRGDVITVAHPLLDDGELVVRLSGPDWLRRSVEDGEL